mmetsp:Transcript_21595/g.65353  ORF Transcript_21595/g.65353 Transcript_21595/m.65353 type:complete len:134 (+) Transcript_21595:116-517(+)
MTSGIKQRPASSAAGTVPLCPPQPTLWVLSEGASRAELITPVYRELGVLGQKILNCHRCTFFFEGVVNQYPAARAHQAMVGLQVCHHTFIGMIGILHQKDPGRVVITQQRINPSKEGERVPNEMLNCGPPVSA